MASVDQRYRETQERLAARNQAHVLRWWPELSPDERRQLLDDLDTVPWDILDPLIQTHVLSRPPLGSLGDLRPATVYPAEPQPSMCPLYDEAVELGDGLLRDGAVAAFTVAGGQGTRLGFDGPKGALPVTPVRHKSLFQLFAETVIAASRKWGRSIPWYIMTSPANHAQTIAFFEEHSFFGLPAADVMFFSQGVLPAFDFSGRLLLEEKHRLALAPDGHGGSLKALARSGALADMRRRGVTVISYFQVDNPLVRPFDPLFIGLHTKTGSQMATKVTAKADDLERVGNVCLNDGKLTVIEYSDLPESFARARGADGSRTFNAANIAVHLLDTSFVEQLVEHAFSLPFRRAEKAVPFVDETGAVCKPTAPNAVKLESFVFDVLPLARNPLVFEVDRAEEFSPVKNATGVDSLETSRRDQIARACRWLEAASVPIPRSPQGAPTAVVELAPAIALSSEDIPPKRALIPEIRPGDQHALD